MKIGVAQFDAYGPAGVTLSFQVVGHPHAERGKNLGQFCPVLLSV
jgi:hypothetical protein